MVVYLGPGSLEHLGTCLSKQVNLVCIQQNTPVLAYVPLTWIFCSRASDSVNCLSSSSVELCRSCLKCFLLISGIWENRKNNSVDVQWYHECKLESKNCLPGCSCASHAFMQNLTCRNLFVKCRE